MIRLKMHPLVSIITINFNQVQHTCALLNSLKNLNYPNIEIIVVDNHSSESPEKAIIENHPNVKLILSPSNLGFAGGNNLGILQSTGKYLLFLNNDTEVDAEFLQPLVDLFEKNPLAGIASPKILYYNSGNTIQYVGCERVNRYTGRNKRVGFKQKDVGQYDEMKETELIHGAAMMVPKNVIDTVGMMPEVFFLYYEELDWCESIKRNGFKAFVVPASKIYHKESMSIGKNSLLKTYYMTRNRMLYMRRNSNGLAKLVWIIFFIFISIPKNIFMFVYHHEFAHLNAFCKGFLWNVTHLRTGVKIVFKTYSK